MVTDCQSIFFENIQKKFTLSEGFSIFLKFYQFVQLSRALS